MDSETLILQALYAFPYLSVKQVHRLLYFDAKHKRSHELLKKLFDKEEVDRDPVFSQIKSGSNADIYWLITKGRNRLKKSNPRLYDFSTWRYPSEMKPFIKSSHFPHYMMTTDFLIEVSFTPGVTVSELMHDFTLKRIRNASVIPDGWLHIAKPNGKHLYFCIEIDMDSEKKQEFLDKIGNIVWFMEQEEYQGMYGTHIPLWVFWTPKGEGRRDEMLSWIEEKLKLMYMDEKYTMFRVGSAPLSPNLFYEKQWYIPSMGQKRQVGALLT